MARYQYIQLCSVKDRTCLYAVRTQISYFKALIRHEHYCCLLRCGGCEKQKIHKERVNG